MKIRVWIGVLICFGWLQAGLPKWTESDREAFWGTYQDKADWPKAAEHLRVGLIKEWDASQILSEKFRNWLWQMEWAQRGSGLREVNEKAFVKMAIRDPALVQLLMEHLHPKDQLGKVFETYLRLYDEDEKSLRAYPQLGVAYAVVFDRPFPSFWPHSQVSSSLVPFGDDDPLTRFQHYVKLDQSGALDHKLTELSVNELKFLVDSKVSLAELDWARNKKNVKTRLSKAEHLFSMIEYDFPRLQKGFFSWPQPTEYTCANILEKGGICVDQAYFAATVGKARGIPTLYFSGQGRGGGHAWFGYLKRKGTWETDVGRYAAQNYPIGEARDPQTWESINDAELAFLSKDVERDVKYGDSRLLLHFSRHYPEKAGTILEKARRTFPENLAVWRASALWAKAAGLPVKERKALLQAWIKEFRSQSDAKLEGQMLLKDVLKEEGDTKAYEALQKSIVLHNRRERFDLGIGAGSEALLEKIDRGNWKDADREFRRMVRKFDDQGGGHLFYKLVRPYVESLLEAGQFKLAEDALEFAQKKMRSSRDSILAMEFAALRQRVENREEPKLSL